SIDFRLCQSIHLGCIHLVRFQRDSFSSTYFAASYDRGCSYSTNDEYYRCWYDDTTNRNKSPTSISKSNTNNGSNTYSQSIRSRWIL
ncbi:hypothetical protein BLA29_006952, partial [Euroglyphus maynei]